MFFIVNKTKQVIVINDMGVKNGITLGPRCAIDLDKQISRDKSEKSKELQYAKKKGLIEVRIKDGKKPTNPTSKSKQPDSLDSFKKEIIKEMKEALSQQAQPSTPSGISKDDLKEFAKEIIKSMPKQETVVMQRQSQEVRTDEKVEVDSDVLSEINARAVSKMIKGTDVSGIKYKEEVKKDDILSNVEELEGLI